MRRTHSNARSTPMAGESKEAIASYEESEVNREFLYLQVRYGSPKLSLFFAEEIDIKDSFHSFDIAVDFGVGGQLPAGPIKIMLEARYEQGLLNIIDDTIDEDALKSRLRSSGFQLLAGILLPLGGGQ